MKVLFVCGSNFSGPSEKQALGFAEQLGRLGHPSAVAVRGPADTQDAIGVAPEGVTCLGYRIGPRGADHGFRDAVRTLAPDVVHAFNPRVPVMAAARDALAASPGARLWVHFEDDEWGLASAPGGSLVRRGGKRLARAAAPVHPGVWHLATPRSLREARDRAAGFDALTPALAAEIERRTGRPASVVLPVLPELPAVSTPALSALDRPAARTVVYTGGVFGAHVEDFRLLLQAIASLRGDGLDVGLVHAGAVAPRWPPAELCRDAGLDPAATRFLGPLPLSQMPGLLALGDVLPQPGGPSTFNRLRLPSKLQSYLASGRPVVTFAVGFGELLEDGTEVLKTQTAAPDELAGRIALLLEDDALARRVGDGGRVAAERLFDPKRNALALLAAYGA